MPRRCCVVPGCGKTFLRKLPKDTDVREKWIQFIFNERPSHVSADLHVCTVHFTSDCFENKLQLDTGFAQKLLLKDQAVPTVLEPARTPQTNESRPVEMMYQKKKFPFRCIPEYELQVLELPYKQELSMLILLPNETQDGSDPLLKLESELTLDKLLDWTNTDEMTRRMDIRVHLPKFKLEVESSLSKILQEMGMSSVFQETKADLTGMSSQDGLFISAVFHKAFVEVNEEGTEAAAATGFVLGSCPSKQDPQNFIADHPFIFFIRHNPTNSILFLGRFRGPS